MGFDALAQGQDLTPDPDTTRPSYLVFRMPALADGGIAPGWYAPVLEVPAVYFKSPGPNALPGHRFTDDSINYTFSVGKPMSNVKLLASLVQTNQNAPGAPTEGRSGASGWPSSRPSSTSGSPSWGRR